MKYGEMKTSLKCLGWDMSGPSGSLSKYVGWREPSELSLRRGRIGNDEPFLILRVLDNS